MDPAPPVLWGKVLDQSLCIGCHACSTACKSENEVPISVQRTYVKSVEVGTFPDVRRSFQVTRCNQCQNPPCVEACPTAAMFQRPDGIVDFDKSACIGCKACIAACPYDAIFINPTDHSAEKCNFCAHRLEMGLEPACVVACPVQAISVGNLLDPASKVARTIAAEPVAVRRPEQQTQPKVFYVGASSATLEPLAARRPDGGLYMWSQQPSGPAEVGAGVPSGWNSSAAAVLAYDVSHHAPWDWRVSLYTWSKGIAAGAYLTPLLLLALGGLAASSPLWRFAAPLVGGFFLALTGSILIWDLEHPGRFLYLFRRPQWRSWLVRGGILITAYGLLLLIHLLLALAGDDRVLAALAVIGAPLAVAAAAYTAYLFAQAKARELWQSRLLAPHLLVQALYLGAAVMLPAAAALDRSALAPLAWVLAAGALGHLVLTGWECRARHASTQARLAVHNLVRGRYRAAFWSGLVLVGLSLTAPLLNGLVVLAALPALAGLFLHEHAYIQAGQSVPLA
ncbi:MAG: 4Fe-4S dicluster domain-containing protein [Candidatus Dormibacteraceae bacterium]